MIFTKVKNELTQPLAKEDEEVFPWFLRKNRKHSSLLEEIEQEHEHAGDLLHKMIEVTNRFQLPEDRCRPMRYRLKAERVDFG